MTESIYNKETKLSRHFTLGEMTKTSHKTADGNKPSEKVVENIKRVCKWLEKLRAEYNKRYAGTGVRGCEGTNAHEYEEPIIINSGYRSPAVNKAVGGAVGSNHLTGCAADIRVLGCEQMFRYATILTDISDESREDFDELLLERRGSTLWIHFAVRPSGNRRKMRIICL